MRLRLQGVQVLGRLRCVAGGGEDGSLVVLQDFEPMLDVGGVVLANLRRDGKVRTEKRTGKLGDEFLHRVAFVSPAFAAKLAVKA